MSGWILHFADLHGDLHVTPVDDLRPHEVCCRCWCRPVRDAGTNEVVLHQALDQRERYERGELRLQ